MIDLTTTESIVWCDEWGDTHAIDDLDPENNGPIDPRTVSDWEREHLAESPAWTLEDRDGVIAGGYGKVWHYVCQGPHYRLHRGRTYP